MPDSLERRVIVDGADGAASLIKRMARLAEGLAPASSWLEAAQSARALMESETNEIGALLKGHDVYDVLELVRQHEFAQRMMNPHESQSDSLIAVVDVVALVALDLGTRHPAAQGDNESDLPQPNTIVEDICYKARRVLQAATFLAMSIMGDPSLGPLSELAAQLRSSELTVRVSITGQSVMR